MYGYIKLISGALILDTNNIFKKRPRSLPCRIAAATTTPVTAATTTPAPATATTTTMRTTTAIIITIVKVNASSKQSGRNVVSDGL